MEGVKNPADICSRGVFNPKQLTEMDKHGKSWLSGPQFLRENEGSWYATSVQPLGVDDAEIKQSDTFVGVSTIQKLDIDVTHIHHGQKWFE